MTSLCFYFQMHQPLRINPTADTLENLFQGSDDPNVDNKRILENVVNKCYKPATQMMVDLLNRFPNFKISYSISGVLIDQLEKDFPEVIQLLQEAAKTGRTEFLDETYFHSLASIYSPGEFADQIKLHNSKIMELFDQEPVTFRNTEIIYSDQIGEKIKNLGYKTILAEGADRIIGWLNPNNLFKTTSGMNLLLKNYKLSDDIAFRFSDKSSADYPITLEKYLRRLKAIQKTDNDLVNIFIDYETFGEHQWKDSGIFEFFIGLISELNNSNFGFLNPKDTENLAAKQEISMPGYVSWADYERDTSAWDSNEIQQESIKAIYELENAVKSKDNEKLLQTWRYLQTSDHFYYMCTKKYGGENSDIDVHSYFSPYDTPRKAYEAYMNAISVLKSNL